MMISSQSYIDEFRQESFEALIKERERLYTEIKKLEKDAYDPDKSSDAWNICPGPDVQYQMHLEYLAELCNFIAEKYRTEIVWGGSIEE